LTEGTTEVGTERGNDPRRPPGQREPMDWQTADLPNPRPAG
jgi:hypothetical protein